MNLMFDIDSNISFEKVDELNESTGKNEKKYKIKGIFQLSVKRTEMVVFILLRFGNPRLMNTRRKLKRALTIA